MGRFMLLYRRGRRAARIEVVMNELYEELWDEEPNNISKYSQKLRNLGPDLVILDLPSIW